MVLRRLAARLQQPYNLSTAPLLDFLAPGVCSGSWVKPFSSTSHWRSRIGSAPLSLPTEVNLRVIEPPPMKQSVIRKAEPRRKIEVEGPRGKISFEIPPFISIDHDQSSRKVALSIADRNERKQREMWGTTRADLNNHILGVSEGHTAVLRLVGVGFRATVEPSAITKQPEYPGQQFVSLKAGYSHPIEMPIPLGMKASVPQPTRILLEGPVKEIVNQFAAEIRLWRVPEPYKGKGIFVNGETIKMKAKKIK